MSDRPTSGFDALLPEDMARKATEIGAAKARQPIGKLFVLGVLAGAFIGLGAVFATTVTTGGSAMPFGVTRLLGGMAFSLGLILVIVAGAELFTGNNLIVMALADRRIRWTELARNWLAVYAGNFAGSVATSALVVWSGHHALGGGEVAANAIAIGSAKLSLGWMQAVLLGVLCNALVCLAVWLCFSARTTTDKVLAIVFPITAFVAAGFEHSVANMYFVPTALFLGAEATWLEFFTSNLIPVTLGNIIGGSVLVGAIYWFVYLRRSDRAEIAPAQQRRAGSSR